ncbi:MAG TPA: hypothetical protein DEP01_07810 [Aminobacterium sp.]|jgi:hypothetical protein|uniref:hypothetical protein n=1 Tax=Aminobacterium TaxID=81466 RepID=UPI000466EAD5|nr:MULTISPECIES: hypothetical protein [Aminobacterium]HCA41379.1 hypothetical protein [Aminobacterium sp.]
MKRLFLLFAVAAMVVFAAGAVFAEEAPMTMEEAGFSRCNPSGCSPWDTLKINWRVIPINCLQIRQDEICMATYIGCCDGWCDEECIWYAVVATGTDERKIVGKIDVNMPEHVTLWAKLRAPYGTSAVGTPNWTELSTDYVDLVTGISKICGAWGKGGLKLCAGADAQKGSGVRVLTLLIQDV